jgi:hypothetical protein
MISTAKMRRLLVGRQPLGYGWGLKSGAEFAACDPDQSEDAGTKECEGRGLRGGGGDCRNADVVEIVEAGILTTQEYQLKRARGCSDIEGIRDDRSVREIDKIYDLKGAKVDHQLVRGGRW